MSSIFLFLTIVQALVAAALVGVILMQRSEGGALGMGGSPSGLMSARGAADFLTRTTTLLAILFVSLSIILAVLAAGQGSSQSIDQSLRRDAPIGQDAPRLPPPSSDPLGAAGAGGSPTDGSGASVDPLAPASNEAAPAQGEPAPAN